MSIAGLWVFFACFGHHCLGPETRIVPGLTEMQCRVLLAYYDELKNLELGGLRDFRFVQCISPTGDVQNSK